MTNGEKIFVNLLKLIACFVWISALRSAGASLSAGSEGFWLLILMGLPFGFPYMIHVLPIGGDIYTWILVLGLDFGIGGLIGLVVMAVKMLGYAGGILSGVIGLAVGRAEVSE